MTEKFALLHLLKAINGITLSMPTPQTGKVLVDNSLSAVKTSGENYGTASKNNKEPTPKKEASLGENGEPDFNALESYLIRHEQIVGRVRGKN
jgi:hypothetical protein